MVDLWTPMMFKFKILAWNKETKIFKFFAKINMDEVRMTYVGLSATYERSTTPVSSGV